MFAQTTTATVLALALPTGTVLASERSQSSDTPVVRALRFFEARSESHPVDVLSALRPASLPLAGRQVVLASLPREGEVQPDTGGRAKLAVLRPVLELHERDRVFVVKVIDVAQAFVGLHARTVLLISERALRLLTAPELQLIVAHEVGHEYFWADYERAAAASDQDARREVELRCDAIAVFTALALGLDPAHLRTAVKKLSRFNNLLGATANATSYPTVKERERFIQALIGRSEARDWLLRLGRRTTQ